MKLETEWTDDCQGKKDYDADLVRLSTRYWPHGGGFSTFDTSTGIWADNEARPEAKPSATASIMLQEEAVSTADFKAETEAEVKALVEKWAQEQFDKIELAIRAVFPANVKDHYEVKKLQDIKRRHEADELRMAHEIDQLRGALLAMRDQVESALSMSNEKGQPQPPESGVADTEKL